MKRCY